MTHARWARCSPPSPPHDLQATGKPWRVKGASPRRRSEPSASPRPRPVVLATRVRRAARARNSRLTPPPAHCGGAWDSLLPARTRRLGIPRERSQREKGLFCEREQTLLPSLRLRTDGGPFSSRPEFYLYSLVRWPSPYRSAAGLAIPAPIPFLLCSHTCQGSLSFRGEVPFLSLASKALHAQLSSSSGLITIGLQPPLIPGPKDLKVTMQEAPLPSPSSEYALPGHHFVDS